MQIVMANLMFITVCSIQLTSLIFIPAHAHSCTYKSGDLRYKECSNIVTVNWYDLPPYVYRNGSNVDGVLKTVVERLVRGCCGKCVQFEYLNPMLDSSALEAAIGRNGSVLNFPIYGTIVSNKFDMYPYFPIIESPGVIYVTKMPAVGKASEMLMKSVGKAWPILVVMFLMSAVTGIITWATDSYINPEQFPTPFFDGAWNGFWWSLVSLTTVGYGDMAPKGYAARILAFIWIMIGLCLYALFSGFISTSGTAATLGTKVNLYGKKLVTMNQSKEQRFGIKSNAKITAAGDLENFIKQITSEEVTGGLIDTYYAGHYEKKIRGENIIIGSVLDYQFTYGFAISNEFVASPRIEKCLWKSLSVNEQYIVNLLESNMQAMSELSEAELENISTTIFDYRSPLFLKTVQDSGIILVVLFLLGFLWEYFYMRPKRQKVHPIAASCLATEILVATTSATLTMEELIAMQNRELEEAIWVEVRAFMEAFERREKDCYTVLRDPKFRKIAPTLLSDKEFHFVSYDGQLR